MKLKRTYLDVKRLATSVTNINFRGFQWILDYIRCIVKPLQTSNNDFQKHAKDVSENVLYTGQMLSIKTLVDDKVDFINRESYITDNYFTSLTMFGYNNSETYFLEPDPNPTDLYGYYDYNTNEFIIETPDVEVLSTLGYVEFGNMEPLQDVNSEFILDSTNDFIYTLDGEITDTYTFFREGFSEATNLTIWIREAIYNTLTSYYIQYLYSLVYKYIKAPVTFDIKPF